MLLTIKQKENTHKFLIEVPQEDGTLKPIKGKIRDFTEDEQTQYNEKYQDTIKVMIELSSIAEKLKDLTLLKDVAIEDNNKREAVKHIKEIKELQARLKEIDTDLNIQEATTAMIKDRYNTCLLDGKDEILSLCEQYGYSLVNETLLKAIDEGKSNG